MGDMADDCSEQEERKSTGEICWSCGCPIDNNNYEGKPQLCSECNYTNPEEGE